MSSQLLAQKLASIISKSNIIRMKMALIASRAAACVARMNQGGPDTPPDPSVPTPPYFTITRSAESLTVTFDITYARLSTKVTKYVWDFGDGTSETQLNTGYSAVEWVEHTFPVGNANYNVRLYVHDVELGVLTYAETFYLNVQARSIDFTGTEIYNNSQANYSFLATITPPVSGGGDVLYSWRFDPEEDQTPSSPYSNVFHKYLTSGRRMVSVWAWHESFLAGPLIMDKYIDVTQGASGGGGGSQGHEVVISPNKQMQQSTYGDGNKLYIFQSDEDTSGGGGEVYFTADISNKATLPNSDETKFTFTHADGSANLQIHTAFYHNGQASSTTAGGLENNIAYFYLGKDNASGGQVRFGQPAQFFNDTYVVFKITPDNSTYPPFYIRVNGWKVRPE